MEAPQIGVVSSGQSWHDSISYPTPSYIVILKEDSVTDNFPRPRPNLIAVFSALFLALLSCQGLGDMILILGYWLEDSPRDPSSLLGEGLPMLMILPMPFLAALFVTYGVLRRRKWSYWPMIVCMTIATAASIFIFVRSELRSIEWLIIALGCAIAVWQFLKNPSIRRWLNVSASD